MVTKSKVSEKIMAEPVKKHKKVLTGVVVKKSGNKSIVVLVERRYKHDEYSKYITRAKKFHAHDEKNEHEVGKQVTIVESRPLSKLKRWVVL